MLLHGWGLNARVWDCVTPELACTLRCIWLTCRDMVVAAFRRSVAGRDGTAGTEPARSRLSGWAGALGGLVASQIALQHPGRVQALVTVASSPCFGADGDWPGIKAEVLSGFQQQLSEDFQRTVERFLALQNAGDGKRSPGCPGVEK